jgi:predicted DNA-binding transcriptional regulator AlpA
VSNRNSRIPTTPGSTRRRKASTRPTPTRPPSRSDGDDPFLTVSEVLIELKVARSTFDDWRIKGVGPDHVKLPNGQLRVRRSALDSWLAARTTGSRR